MPRTQRPEVVPVMVPTRVTLRVKEPTETDEDDVRVAWVEAWVRGTLVGVVTLEHGCDLRFLADDDLACRDDLATVTARLGLRGAAPLAVIASWVAPALWGRGVGLALYESALWYARTRHDSPLVAQACCGGTTSDAARRVWRSARLAKVAVVRGLVAGWIGPDLSMARSVVL